MISLSSCNTADTFHNKQSVYSFNQPDSIRELPSVLHEISGIVALSDSVAATVQDELGTVFIYDLKFGKILSEVHFAGPGDYEGVTSVRDTLFVLRSDGLVYRIADFTANPVVDSIDTGIKTKNNEGLCYDPNNRKLLIAAKSKMAKGKAFKDKRIIYALPIDGQHKAEELFTIDVAQVIEIAKSRGIQLPDVQKKSGETQKDILKFKMSELAFEPASNRLFVLSAADHFLFTFSMQGEIGEIHSLDPVLYNKPEGITFIGQNRIIISNEGQKKSPTLIYLNNKSLE